MAKTTSLENKNIPYSPIITIKGTIGAYYH